MASQIAVIAPVGTNLLTGSPSLTPILAASAWDSTSSSSVVGTGSSWIQPGQVSAPTVITGITFTASGTGPNIVNCTLTVQTLSVGSNNIKVFGLNLNGQTITPLETFQSFTAAAGTIPSAFCPTYYTSATLYFIYNGTQDSTTVIIYPNGSVVFGAEYGGTYQFQSSAGIYI